MIKDKGASGWRSVSARAIELNPLVRTVFKNCYGQDGYYRIANLPSREL